MKLFIDNIPTLVTEVMLLAPTSRMFCPKLVYTMNLEMTAQIASEPKEKGGNEKSSVGSSRRSRVVGHLQKTCCENESW